MNSRSHAPVSAGTNFSRVLSRSAHCGAPLRATGAVALIAVLAFSSVGSARLHAQSANSLYKSGQAAEAREDYDAAYDFYQKANAKNPKDITYRIALYRVRTSASGMHVTNGRKLLQEGNEPGRIGPVPARSCARSQQRGGLAGNPQAASQKNPISSTARSSHTAGGRRTAGN